MGVGKTTATRGLAARLDLPAFLEDAATNPFLSGSYSDPKRWAIRSQFWFLLDSIERHRVIAASPKRGVQDHSYYEAFWVYGQVQRDFGYLTAEDLALLERARDIGDAMLPSPDLVVHLTAPLRVLEARIDARGRECERGLSLDYLAALDGRRQDLFRGWDRCPVMTVDTTALDLRSAAGIAALTEASAPFTRSRRCGWLGG